MQQLKTKTFNGVCYWVMHCAKKTSRKQLGVSFTSKWLIHKEIAIYKVKLPSEPFTIWFLLKGGSSAESLSSRLEMQELFFPRFGVVFFLIDIFISVWKQKKANIFLSFALGRPVWTRSIKKKITCDSHKSCLSPQIRSTTQVCRSSQRLTAGSQINVSPVAPFVYDSIAFPGDSGRSFCKQSDRLKQAMGGGGLLLRWLATSAIHYTFETKSFSNTHTNSRVWQETLVPSTD